MGLDELRVRYSLVLEFNRFTNVHLFEKGFYQLRATVSGPPNTAVLCEQLKLDEDDSRAQFDFGPGIQDNTAISSTFRVIMKKSVVKLNNAYIYSVDVPGDVCDFVKSCTVPINIQFQLLHNKLSRRPKNPDSLELCATLDVCLNYSPVYGLHYCKEDMFDYMYMGQIRYSVHMVMVDIDNPPHTLFSHCWDNKLPVLMVLDEPGDNYKEVIQNVAALLCGTLLAAYDFLKSTFSNLQDTLPVQYRQELHPADAVLSLQTVLSTLDNIDTIDEAQDQFIHDLKSISKSIHILWFEFLECFIHSNHIQQVLLEKFRAVQLERSKEACFTQSHPHEKCQSYTGPTLTANVGNFIRSSRYMNTIPSLPLQADANDGSAAEIPIIIEDTFDWEPYDSNNMTVPEEVLTDAMTELRVWDPIMRRPHTVVQLDTEKIKHWRESQGNGGGPSLDSEGDRRRSSSAALSDVPIPTTTNSTNSTFYTTTNDVQQNLLIVDLEPSALDPNIQQSFDLDPPPNNKEIITNGHTTPTEPINLLQIEPMISEKHKLIVQISRRTIRLLKSEVTHINFEQSRRQLIGSPLLEQLHFLTDTEGSRMSGQIFSSSPHLVVCCHGLEGAAHDLRLVKIFMQLALPKSELHFLMSEANSDDTYNCVTVMGKRLASEILEHIKNSQKNFERISFIGHSLGCLIIRSCLAEPSMTHLSDRYHTYMGFSGPHLGMLYGPSYLVSGGLWLMQRLKNSVSLNQMGMKDRGDLRDCFLFRLSKKDQLKHFKNVVLLSSHQDRYVPFHSTRIEMCSDASKDTSYQGSVYRDMVYNIMKPIADNPACNIVRYSVQYHLEQSSASSMIGRAAHIAFLDSEVFLNKFFSVIGWKYFV